MFASSLKFVLHCAICRSKVVLCACKDCNKAKYSDFNVSAGLDGGLGTCARGGGIDD